jgi:predicted Zn finger-like uncharacterized protein
MKIECPKCKAAYKVDDTKLPEEGVNVKCQKCEYQFFIKKEITLSLDSSEQIEGKLESSAEAGTNIKDCPRCKLPQKGIDECEYCGLIFEKKTKKPDVNITKKLSKQDFKTNLIPSKSKTKSRKRTILVCSIIFFVAFIVFYTQFTIFVIQPIGAIPEGKSLIISRLNKTKFIDSADAMCERMQGGVNLLCRGMVLGTVSKNAKVYARLPYSELLYLISTNGVTYTKNED